MRKQVCPGLSPDFYTAQWILCLARLHPGKGQDIALKVWRELPETVRTGLVLFFVGQETQVGYREILQEDIRRAPHSERIILAGPSEHPQDWIQCADLFLSGSLHEGMPLAPLEAVGAGLPVLLTRIEGHQFLKPWASLFDPETPEEGAKETLAILNMLSQNGGSHFF